MPVVWAGVTLDALALRRRRLITGLFGGRIDPDRDIPEYVRYDENGDVNLGALKTFKVSLNDINTGIALFQDPNVTGRVVVGLSGHDSEN